MMTIPVERCGQLWIAQPLTRYGPMEFFCGEGDEPDVGALLLMEQFLGTPIDHLGTVRRSAFLLPRFWRPIRLAINNDGRLGIQFRHRISGKQRGMFFADEHSGFGTKLADVIIREGDLERLMGRSGSQ